MGQAFKKEYGKYLHAIKPGQTRTYGDIARQLNSSPRAVGNACRSNPVPIFIPCHRVVSASGRGGFMGHTSGEPLEIKEWLLTHESKTHCSRVTVVYESGGSNSSIDDFIDSLWLEDGLSDNTLLAYRRDLEGFSLWLEK